ncbi:hypothetical protein ATC04_01975 [Arthrobacter sp. YC-RL1]|nr:hypothetical protein ATC04_01975 [Arthrobacter sp. YC-RL1]
MLLFSCQPMGDLLVLRILFSVECEGCCYASEGFLIAGLEQLSHHSDHRFSESCKDSDGLSVTAFELGSDDQECFSVLANEGGE